MKVLTHYTVQHLGKATGSWLVDTLHNNSITSAVDH